jgi:AraC-like DNA-binding protein
MKRVPLIEYCGTLISEGYYRLFCISFMMTFIAITLSLLKMEGFFGIALLSFIAVLMIILNLLFCMCDLGGYDTLATENELLTLKKLFGNTQGVGRISVSSDEKMRVLYERVTEYMDSNKPFLNENFEILDLASSVFSNKTYLSRTINAFSGQNFRQFVNGYRIRYAVRVLKDDPHLRMSEVADLCGFHNIVTFNMAFKLNMRETPTEWCQGYRASIRIGGVKHRYSQETSMSGA